MSIGFMLDLITENNNAYLTNKRLSEEKDKPKVRKATQLDFDRF